MPVINSLLVEYIKNVANDREQILTEEQLIDVVFELDVYVSTILDGMLAGGGGYSYTIDCHLPYHNHSAHPKKIVTCKGCKADFCKKHRMNVCPLCGGDFL